MSPVFKEVFVPKNFNEVPVSPKLAMVIKQAETREWVNLFNCIRLNLQGRIESTKTEDLEKLQGAIKNIGEIETLFQQIVAKNV